MRKTVSALFCTTALMALFTSVSAETIKYVGPSYCPFVCDTALADTPGPGFIAELVVKSYEVTGREPPTVKARERDDHRARATVATGSADITFGTEAGFNLNPRVSHVPTPLLTFSAVIITRANDPYRFNSLKDPELLQKKIGWAKKVPPPMIITELMDRKTLKNTVVWIETGPTMNQQLLQMLNDGDIDFIMEAREFIVADLENSPNRDNLLLTDMNEPLHVYLGHNSFLPEGKAVGNVLNEGLSILSEEGFIDQIAAKYFGM